MIIIKQSFNLFTYFKLDLLQIIYQNLLKQISIINLQIPAKMISAIQAKYPNMPYLYAVSSNFARILFQICMKNVANVVGPTYALILRGGFLFILNTLIIVYNNYSLHTSNSKVYTLCIQWLITTGISLSCIMIPLVYIPSGIAMSLFNTCPVIIFFLQAYFQNKQIHKIHLIFTFISFTGVLIIVRPDLLWSQNQEDKYLGIFYILPLISAIFHALSMLVLHKLKGQANSFQILQYFYIGHVTLNALLTMLYPLQVKNQGINFGFFVSLVGLVVFSFVSQFLNAQAILLKPASYILPFGYLQVIGNSLVDIFLFNYSFTMLTIVGIMLTSIGLLSKIFIKQ